MKRLTKIIILAVAVALFAKCSKSNEPSATSAVSIKMSAVSTSDPNVTSGRMSLSGARSSSDSVSGVSLTDAMVNARSIKFDFDQSDERSEHKKHEHDTVSYDEDDDVRLKGPFLVDLMNAGSFIDQIVTSVNVPNGVYERVRFKLAPSEASGEMAGKSIRVTGKIDTIPFIFWHKRDLNFGARFYSNDSTSTDSTTLNVNGKAVTLAIHLELNKILNALNGGVDLSKSVDGNKDGVITIDPLDTDGNKWIADEIMMRLQRHAGCLRRQD